MKKPVFAILLLFLFGFVLFFGGYFLYNFFFPKASISSSVNAPFKLSKNKEAQILIQYRLQPQESKAVQLKKQKNAQREILSEGVSDTVLLFLENHYKSLQNYSDWYLFCDQLSQTFWPNPKKEILSPENQIWRSPELAFFCFKGLFHNHYYDEILEILGRNQESTLWQNLHEKYLFIQLTALNKTIKTSMALKNCKQYQLAVEKFPNLLDQCAIAYSQLKDYQSARQFWRRAFKLVPQKEYLINISKTYLAQNDKEKAARTLLAIPRH